MGSPTTHLSRGLSQQHVPLRAERPLLLTDNRTIGTCVISSLDSDLETFSHNPAHGSFTPLAFQPSSMTNCANQRFLSTVGKSRHRRIKKQHRYELGCHKPVIPVLNSPPDNIFRPNQPAKASLMSKKRGSVALPFHEINDEAFGYLKRVIVTPAIYLRLVEFLHSDIQSTWMRQLALTVEAAQAVHRQSMGSRLGLSCLALRANPFPGNWKEPEEEEEDFLVLRLRKKEKNSKEVSIMADFDPLCTLMVSYSVLSSQEELRGEV
ncbi:putative senescence-associated protein [Cucumis melo var. makuwa]|uniref:Senescence-associated protein n=1 Tax=Cucumis melo var. makuwa TaxID=1194695 RepID=A0A5A7VGW1_CUCMM|nr:putative senescence-associated protein [Cucumis melo var. makuwa]